MISHRRLMMRAIRLARKAEGRTFPNPMVGALLVKKGKVIADGYHRKAGSPHAEAITLLKAKKKASGASLYVSLEPCAHYGKTPPCADSIVKSGIKRVYVAMKDPNPLVNGKGIDRLRKNGVHVKIGILRGEARSLNKAYIDFITREKK